jgi:hypothetical protein
VNVSICEVPMTEKIDSYISEDKWKGGREWRLEFPYAPEFPYPFPIVPAGTLPKHDAVGHLVAGGTVHVFNDGIIERLVRAGLRMRVSGNGTKSGGGKDV